MIETLSGRVYGVALLTMAAPLLGLYLACMTGGVITLCLYENLSGLGLMLLGVILYAAGALALEEGRAALQPALKGPAVKRPVRA